MDRVDVAIVGGGIVGSAVAYFLAVEHRFNGRIALIERDTSYREASTARSAGGVRQQFSTPENIAMSQFALETLRTLKSRFDAQADVAFREQGYLILASAQGAPVLAENVALQQAMGADIALLDPAGLAARFPWLDADGIAAGAHGQSGEGWFDPVSLATLLRQAAVAAGVVVLKDEVVGIDVGGTYRIESVTLAGGGRLGCRLLVNAAGAWAGRLAALAGVCLPVEPRKRFVYVLDCREPPKALRHAPLTVDPAGVWFRPEGQMFLCGKSPEEEQEPPVGNLEDIDHAFFETAIWPKLAARVPVFERVKVVNAWAGYYDTNTLDHNAVIGPHPQITNLYFAAGFSGHGAQQGPAAGRAIAELIVEGAYQSIDLSRLGYDRIAQGAPLRERNVI
ncbi:MAG TPA: FAD-binding oxidoreductase [Hyphomicrobiaceae bacterium]|nr:FAD-binding oxidoreductase [Hyphomicrobiaceae bacterium]